MVHGGPDEEEYGTATPSSSEDADCSHRNSGKSTLSSFRWDAAIEPCTQVTRSLVQAYLWDAVMCRHVYTTSRYTDHTSVLQSLANCSSGLVCRSSSLA